MCHEDLFSVIPLQLSFQTFSHEFGGMIIRFRLAGCLCLIGIEISAIYFSSKLSYSVCWRENDIHKLVYSNYTKYCFVFSVQLSRFPWILQPTTNTRFSFLFSIHFGYLVFEWEISSFLYYMQVLRIWLLSCLSAHFGMTSIPSVQPALNNVWPNNCFNSIHFLPLLKNFKLILKSIRVI